MPKNPFQRAWKDYCGGSFSGYTTLTEWYCLQLIHVCIGAILGVGLSLIEDQIIRVPTGVFAILLLPLWLWLSLLWVATVNRRMRSIWGRTHQSWLLMLSAPISALGLVARDADSFLG